MLNLPDAGFIGHVEKVSSIWDIFQGKEASVGLRIGSGGGNLG